MKIETITEKEYLGLLHKYMKIIPIYTDNEAIECYKDRELIKVTKNNNPIAVFIIPIDNQGVRRKYRFFPYLMPIILESKSSIEKKGIYELIFNYLFNKYNYVFIPIHPEYKLISAISAEGGFVEMRHTHILRDKLVFEELSPKLRNHVRSAMKQVEIIIDNSYQNYDFAKAIKGNLEEIEERSTLAKKLLDAKKGFTVKAKYNNEIIAGLVIIYDNDWSYLLHSYQDGSIRGIVPYLILMASNYAFDEKKVKFFDFEGSVIDKIDDFFTSFNAEIITYPFVIYSNDEKEFQKLINKSRNIIGRIKSENEEN